MIDISIAKVTEIYVHNIGDDESPQSISLSEFPIHIYDDKMHSQLLAYFKQIYNEHEWFAFLDREEHISGSNEMYRFADSLFNDKEERHLEISQKITEFLAEKSTHPNIKSGELIIAKINEIILHDEIIDAIAIIKSESKQNFFKTKITNGRADISIDQGIYTKKIDKGCLIFNTQKDNGYRLCIKDNAAKGETAAFWKTDFLFAGLKMEDYQFTQVYMQATEQFIADKIAEGEESDKGQEIHYKNKSSEYFNNSETFDWEEYKSELFEDEETREEFEEYKNKVAQQAQNRLPQQFDISQNSVDRNKKYFRSVIKLDKNFHIYVHGKREMIERGEDPDGRKYYKLYYNEES